MDENRNDAKAPAMNAVSTLQKWLTQQEFRTRSDEEYLQHVLHCVNLDTDKAKQLVEHDALFRVTNAAYFYTEASQVDVIQLKQILDSELLVPLPGSGEEQRLLLRASSWRPAQLSVQQLLRLCLLVADLTPASRPLQVLVDFASCGLSHLTALSPHVARDLCRILESWPNRVRAIHAVNSPNVLNAFFALVRSSLPQELRDNLIVHSDFKSLHAIFPTNCLPKNLGGNSDARASVTTLREKVLAMLGQVDLWSVISYDVSTTPLSPSTSSFKSPTNVYRSIF